MRKTIHCIAIFILLAAMASTAKADLHNRLNGAAAYDDALDITWLTNAGMSGSNGWEDQLAWIDGLNNSAHLGFSDWRLASMSVPAGVPTGLAESVFDCAVIWTPLCMENELGYMYFYNLGGAAGDDLTGDHTVGEVTITNVMPTYLSGTEFTSSSIWMLHFDSGFTVWSFKSGNRHAWAVRDGDIAADTDGDGVVDALDNCLLAENAAQIDSDGDGYGNRCDQDLDNSGMVNYIDIALFSQLFGSAGGIADFNGDGTVNFLDYALFPQAMFQAPGPSGLVP